MLHNPIHGMKRVNGDGYYPGKLIKYFPRDRVSPINVVGIALTWKQTLGLFSIVHGKPFSKSNCALSINDYS